MSYPGLRTASFLLLATTALALSSCSSNNDGKIIGKWKAESSSKGTDIAELKQSGVYLYFEFKTDNTVIVGLGADNPEILAILKASGQKTESSGQYKLGAGDTVRINNLVGLDGKTTERAQTKITIAGDNMIMRDPDGTVVTLTRLVAGATPAATPAPATDPAPAGGAPNTPVAPPPPKGTGIQKRNPGKNP